MRYAVTCSVSQDCLARLHLAAHQAGTDVSVIASVALEQFNPAPADLPIPFVPAKRGVGRAKSKNKSPRRR